ncbi:hypothetical protein DXG01_011531, partial [Tephrocybe rancida]
MSTTESPGAVVLWRPKRNTKGELRMNKAKKFREEVDEVFGTVKEKYWSYVTE